MARPTVPHSSDFAFPVTMQPLTLPGGHQTGFWSPTREINGVPKALGVTSENYGLVLNEEFINKIEEGFTKANLSGFEREVAVMDHGKRCQASWVFRNRTIKVRKVGDQLAFKVTARNSYDGSWRVSLIDTVERLVCTNGAVRSEKGLMLTGKHTARLDIGRIVGGLDAMLKRFETWAADLDLLVLPITQAEGYHILNHAQDQQIISGSTREGILGYWNSPRRVEDQDRTLYNLWNAGTEYLTHVARRERFEFSETVNSELTTWMMGLGRDSGRLSKVRQPLEELAVN